MNEKILDELAVKLKEVKAGKYRGINYFSAVKMINQEVRHSAFIAWLMHTDNAHGLGSCFIEIICDSLYEYETHPDSKTSEVEQNSQILNNSFVSSKEELLDLVSGKTIVATVEYPTDNGRYLDILLDVKGSQTVIVIENKVDTTVHDDQLTDYYEFIQTRSVDFKNYKHKIYIYLSKEGELPYDTSSKKYNEHWCMLDYEKIVSAINDLILSAEKSQNHKLKYILEDYKEMVDVEILKKNIVVRQKCDEILKNPVYFEGLQLLNYYLQNYNTYANVLNYCKCWLQDKTQSGLVGVEIIDDNMKSFSFLTNRIKTELLRLGETSEVINKRYRCFCGSDDATVITGYIHLLKDKSQKWSDVQRKALDVFDPNTACETQVAYGEGRRRNKQISAQTPGDKELKDIEKELIEELKEYVIKIHKFEDMLASLN